MVVDPPFENHAEMFRVIDFIGHSGAPWQCLKDRNTGLRPEGVVLPSAWFWRDKATLSVASEQNDHYPLYMFIGNLDNSARRTHRDSVLRTESKRVRCSCAEASY